MQNLYPSIDKGKLHNTIRFSNTLKKLRTLFLWVTHQYFSLIMEKRQKENKSDETIKFPQRKKNP